MIAVERDDVPGAEVEAVVPGAGQACVQAEVVVIRNGAGSLVVVIPRSRPRPVLVPSPCRTIAVAKLFRRPQDLRVVAEREHRAPDAIQQTRRRFRVAVAGAQADVAGADEDFGYRRLDDRQIAVFRHGEKRAGCAGRHASRTGHRLVLPATLGDGRAQQNDDDDGRPGSHVNRVRPRARARRWTSRRATELPGVVPNDFVFGPSPQADLREFRVSLEGAAGGQRYVFGPGRD